MGRKEHAGAETPDRPNHYKELGLRCDCDTDEVKKKFRVLARTCHPDKQEGIIFRRAAFSSMYGPSIRFRDPSAEKLCVQQVMRYSPALRDIHIRVCFAVAGYTKKRTRSLNTFRTTFRCLPLSF